MAQVAEGGYGVGVDPLGSAYPFVNPSEDLNGLVADFYLGHRVTTITLPLRIDWLYGVTQPPGEGSTSSEAGSSLPGLPDPTHAADLRVVDADDAVVFLSTTASTYRFRDWGRFRIHEWLADDAVCRLLQHLGAHDPEDERETPVQFTPEDGTLDERTHEVWPGQVLQLIADGVEIDGEVRLVNGYNAEFRPGEPSRRDGRPAETKVFTALAAGLGEGTYPACEDPVTVVRHINGVGPDALGNFTLSAVECYRLGRPGTTAVVDGQRLFTPTQAAGLAVANDCTPCCTCDDYVNTYRGVVRLHEEYKVLGVRAQGVRAIYASNRERWLAQKECREGHPLRVVLLPYKGCGTSCVAVAASLGNTASACRGPARLELSFQTSGPTATIDEESVLLYNSQGTPVPYTLGGAWPDVRAVWDLLDPARAGKVRFQFCLDGVVDGDWVQVTATAYINDVQVGSVLVESAALKTPGENCGDSAVNGTIIWGETPAGTVNGVNDTFTLTQTPLDGNLMLFRNGVLQAQGTDYTLSGGTVTFLVVPETGDTLSATYPY